MSPSEEKKSASERAASSTSKDAPLLRRVVEEDAPERPPDEKIRVEAPPDAPAKPKKKNPAEIRAERIKSEIAEYIASGTFKAKYAPDPLVLKPLGAFAECVSSAFAELMETAETEPVDAFTTQVMAEHPDWHPDRVTAVAIQRFVAERGRKAVIAAAKVSSGGNLMYELAGFAVVLPDDVEDPKAWAEKTLLPGECMRIVRAALEIGEIRDYLGESLSILGTEAPEATEEEEEDEKATTTAGSSPAESEAPSSDSTASAPESSSS